MLMLALSLQYIYVVWRKGFIDAKPYTLYLHQIYGTQFGAPRAHIHHTCSFGKGNRLDGGVMGTSFPFEYIVPSMLRKSKANILSFESEPLWQNVEFNLIKQTHVLERNVIHAVYHTKPSRQRKRKIEKCLSILFELVPNQGMMKWILIENIL